MRPLSARSVQRRGFHVRVTRLRDLSPDDFAHWRSLEETAIEPYPQLTAAYLETALRDRDDCGDMQLLIASDAGGWAFLAPVTRATVSTRITLQALSTADDYMRSESARRYPLIDAERGTDALSAVLTSLRALGLPRFFMLSGVDENERLLDVLARATAAARGRTLVQNRYERAVVVPDPSAPRAPHDDRLLSRPADFIPHDRSAESRRKAGRLGRRLQEAVGGDAPVLTLRTDAAIIDDFLELQTRGWKGDESRGGEGYAALGQVDWYRAYTGAFHESGRLLALEVTAGGKLLYMTLCVRLGRTIFGLVDAYDEDFRAFDVGRLSRQAVINLVRGEEIDLFDPNLGWHNAEASRTYPQTRGQQELILTDASLFARAVVLAWAAVRRARRSDDGKVGA